MNQGFDCQLLLIYYLNLARIFTNPENDHI